METKIFTNKILGEDYTVTTLKNGLKIYIYEKLQFNSLYAVYGTKYGSIDSTFNVNGKEYTVPDGIAHFLEHKLFESEDGDAFSKYAKTGAYANAFTSFDRTCYLFSATTNFDENLNILLDFVQNPYFTAETVKKEQGIIGQEIKMYEDSPSWRVMFNMLRAMYFNNPVKIDIAGTVESIAKIDDKILYDCYNTFYNPGNMFACIAGNIKTNDVLEKIQNSVKNKEPINLTRIYPNEPNGVVNDYTEQSLDVAIPLFCYGYKINLQNKVSLYDFIAMNAFLKILADDASPLYKRLTELKLINDEFDAEYFCGNSYSAVIFDGESFNPSQVAKEISREVESIIKNGVDSLLLESVKYDMYGQAVKRYNNVESIGHMLIDAAVFNFDYSNELEIIKNLTETDILNAAALLNKENSVLSVVNKKV
ncbi:MAG: insulinase family protein [Clostridia bacterium]|nr:insulinase family protein [Clostridia bacterium]